jgi:CDP-paratose 2-epimerase
VLYVGDLVRAFDAVRAALPRTAGQIYNVGGGEKNTISLLELMEEIEELTGKRFQLTYSRRRPGDQLIYVSDCSKINRDAGWKPRFSVRETLRAIYEFWKEQPELFGRPALAPSLAASVSLLERTA